MRYLLAALLLLAAPPLVRADTVDLVDVGVWQGTLDAPVFVSLVTHPGATVSPYVNTADLLFSARLLAGVSQAVLLTFEWTLQGVTSTQVWSYVMAGGVPTEFMADLVLPDPGVCCYRGMDGTLRLTLNGGLTANYSYHVLTPAPEPATLLLLGPAMAGLWWRRRRG